VGAKGVPVRTTVVLLLGLLMAQQVWAEWTRIDDGHRGFKNGTYVDGDLYIDASRTKKTKDRYRVWVLADFLMFQYSASHVPFHSTIALYDLDCGQEKTLLLKATDYWGQMSRGDAHPSRRESVWDFPTPGSLNDRIMKAVCEPSLPK
jgi:hypothetical protein